MFVILFPAVFHFQDFQVVSTFYQAYQCVVELHLRIVDGKEVDALFDRLEQLLNSK